MIGSNAFSCSCPASEAIVTVTAGFASGEVTVLIKPRITVTITPPLQATVGVPASFTITPAEDAIVTDVVVDFGDGSDVSLGAITSATQTVHLFKSSGVKSVTATAFAPDGQTLATAAEDGFAILWDLSEPARPRPLGDLDDPLITDPGPIDALAFAPDGNTLVTATGLGTTSRWDLNGLNDLRTHPIEHACAITEHGIGPVEWDRRMSGLPYRDSCGY